MFAGRSVIEVIVLTFTLVAGLSLILLGVTIAIIEIKDPQADTSAAVETLTSVVSAIIGALLGLLAGRAEAARTLARHEEQ